MKHKFHEYVPVLYCVEITYKDGTVDTFENCDDDFVESLARRVFEVFSGLSDGFAFVEYSGEVTAIDVEQMSGVSVYDKKNNRSMKLTSFVRTNMPTPIKMLLL